MTPEAIKDGSDLAVDVLLWITYHRPDMKAGDARRAIHSIFGPEVDARVANILGK